MIAILNLLRAHIVRNVILQSFATSERSLVTSSECPAKRRFSLPTSSVHLAALTISPSQTPTMATSSRSRVFLDVSIGEEPAGRLTIELFTDHAPRTAEK